MSPSFPFPPARNTLAAVIAAGLACGGCAAWGEPADSSSRAAALAGYVAVGVGWDSNVTSGPETDALWIPGLPFPGPVPLGSSRQGSDGATIAAAGLTAAHSVDSGVWLSGSLNVGRNSHFQRHELDEGYTHLDLGGVIQRGRDSWSAGLFGQEFTLGGAPYRDTLGARADWAHELGAGSSLIASLRYSGVTFPGGQGPGGSDRWNVALTHVLQGGERGGIGYGIHGGKEHARSSGETGPNQWSAGLHVNGSLRLTDLLLASAALMAETRRFDSPDGLYRRNREDSQLNLAAALSYRLSKDWLLSPRLSYTHNGSNLALFEFDRFMGTLFLQWSPGNEAPGSAGRPGGGGEVPMAAMQGPVGDIPPPGSIAGFGPVSGPAGVVDPGSPGGATGMGAIGPLPLHLAPPPPPPGPGPGGPPPH